MIRDRQVDWLGRIRDARRRLDPGIWEPIARGRGVVPSAPGLYFTGLAFQYAFASMLVGGAGRDTEYVVKHIAARAANGRFSA